MTSTAPLDVDDLRSRMAGAVVLPTDPGYDEARVMWNGRIDHRPGLVARCTGPADVAAAVGFARSAGLPVAVRGGGHGSWTAALADGFLLVDLSPIRHVDVDPVARTARCGGGVLLAELDGATQQHGLAVPAGTVSHTGIGGLTLGGGWGWLSALHGLTIDNLLSAEVVLADGRVVRASETAHPELFWGLRGGGGNFGVVTEFEFRLHPVGPIIQLGLVFVEQARVAEAAVVALDLMASWPRGVTGGLGFNAAPPAPFVPVEHHFAPGMAVMIGGFADPGEHADVVRATVTALDPLFHVAMPIPYLALQQMLDEASVPGTRAYTKGLYLPGMTPEIAGILADRTALRSPMSQVLAFPLGGALAAVPDDATAFGGDRSGIALAIEGTGHDPSLDDAERDWVRDTWTALRPHARGAGGYVNLMSEVDDTVVGATYGPKTARLAQVKAQYDPENVFRVNANIAPA
ncbi:FAD-binding oxidoreductase [Pseudonocardia pini]|uniref:FAD-binding oxidoreductase n=1 Tax=Pseudonocardia pini TaxID=2758030 RepID=UPI0015F057D1|nr:FAD-binding oxidoreductase [Pseudonocardia pini]